MANSKDKPNRSPSDAQIEIRKVLTEGVETRGYDGGKPRTPAGSNGDKPWQPPKKETTPSNRKK